MCACVRVCRRDKRGNRLEPTTSTHHRLSHTQTSRYLNLRLSLCAPDTWPPLQQPPPDTHHLLPAHTGTLMYQDRNTCMCTRSLFVRGLLLSFCWKLQIFIVWYYYSQLHSIMWHPVIQVVIQRQDFIHSNILENSLHFHFKPIKCL